MSRPLAILAVALFAFYTPKTGNAQVLSFQNSEEQTLITYWEHHKTLDRDILECLLVAEGKADQVARHKEWVSGLEAGIRKEIDVDASIPAKGKGLYRFVHDRVLRKFSGDASVASLMTNGEFNCVTASALYCQLARAIALPVTFHATPFHVCPILSTEDSKIWVELTDPRNGFDAEYKEESLVRFLLDNKLVTSGEVDQKGEEAIYNEFIHGKYRESAAALLGYHYYNQALRLDKNGQREQSFWALAKARCLEEEDEAIRIAFDASFQLVSTQRQFSTSYFKITSTYFHSRGRDSTVIGDAVTGAALAVENIIQSQRNFDQADSILQMMDQTILLTPAVHRSLTELRQSVSVNRGLELNRKGQYDQAYRVIATELQRDSSNALLQDVYVQVGMDYVQRLFISGNDKLALAIVDSLRRKMPAYGGLKDMYSRLTLASIMATGQYRTNPIKACEALTKAFEMDSTNTYVRQALGAVYHELAMAEIRKDNWRSARNQIMQGLRYAPENEYLKSDLSLLKKERPKSAR